jgi:hypothetical protein
MPHASPRLDRQLQVRLLTTLVLRNASGFVISSTLWVASNNIWPPPGVGEIDEGFDLSLRDEPTLTTEEERRESGEEKKLDETPPPVTLIY